MSFEINNSMEENVSLIQLSGSGTYDWNSRNPYPYSVKLIRNTTDNSILLDVLLREDTPIYIEDEAILNPNLNSDTIDKVLRKSMENYTANIVFSLSKHPKLSLETMKYMISRYEAAAQSGDYIVFLIRMCGNENITVEMLDDIAKISDSEGVLQAVLNNQKCSTETIRYLLSGKKDRISISQINNSLFPYAIRNRHCPPDFVIGYMKEHNIIKKQDPDKHDFEYHEEVEKPKNNSLEELKQLISINLNEKITVAQIRDKETQDLVDQFVEKHGYVNPRKWDWLYISKYQELSENFIREFKDYVHWDWISYKQPLSEDFIREFKDRIDWTGISSHIKLSENFIKEFQDRLDWDIISQYQKLSEAFIKEFKDNVSWNIISRYQVLSEDFINEFRDKIHMRILVKYNPFCPPGLKIKYMKDNNLIKKQDPKTHEIEYHEEIEKPKNNSLEELKQLISINLNEKITVAQIRDKETQDLVDQFTKEYGADLNKWSWHAVSVHETLSENFIREFKDKVHWYMISKYQKLSEDFMREFQDKVSWYDISHNQKLSENFIREFQDKVYWNHISLKQILSEDFIEEFKDKINMGYLIRYNPNCPPGLKIKYMKDNNLIKKQDPETHEIEYHEEIEKPKNNSLEELKQLISINLNEKITVAQINKRDKETQDLVNFFTKKYGRNYDLWNWSYVCSEHYKLTENFIREFKNVVEWDYISYYQKLSEDFMREFQDRLNWYYIGAKQILSENFIRDFQDRLDWDIISQYQKLSEAFIKEFKDKMNMGYFAEYNPSCPPELRIKWMKDNNLIKKQDPETHEIEYHEELEKPKNNSLEELKQLISINLNEKITVAQVRDKETQDLVDKLTQKYGSDKDWWNWDEIVAVEKLPEDFIREFQNELNWWDVVLYQKLSEDFIREFQNKVNWSGISYYQELSENFIREFADNINLEHISYSQKLSEDFIREFKNRVHWKNISQSQKLSENFIREFKDKIDMRLLCEYNPNCPPDIKIRYMKEHNLIKKQDPETHDFEYHEEPVTPKPNNSLEELKKLIQ